MNHLFKIVVLLFEMFIQLIVIILPSFLINSSRSASTSCSSDFFPSFLSTIYWLQFVLPTSSWTWVCLPECGGPTRGHILEDRLSRRTPKWSPWVWGAARELFPPPCQNAVDHSCCELLSCPRGKFVSVLPTLTVFPHLLWRCFWTLNRARDIDFPLLAEQSTDAYSLYFDQLWGSALITTHYTKRRLWWTWEMH